MSSAALLDRKERTNVAKRVRSKIVRGGERLWRVEDFDGRPSAVNNELRRLVAKGELERVRRGLYWRGRKGRFGMTSAPSVETLRRTVERDDVIGVAGWQAANALGLSTQVAPNDTLAVTHRRPEGLGNVRIVSRAARSGRRKARLNALEVTLLEALEGWHRYVEADAATAIDRFTELLGRDDVRVDRLVQAAATEPAGVRERLAAVLRHAGYDDAAERIPTARDPRTRERALSVLG